MDEIILRMKGISKWFAGISALSNVDFELARGEVRALIGENGAGKSTLMKILLGIHQADAGEIEFMGKKVHFKEPKDALSVGIAMIHQEISLIPTVDVAENIWMGREDKFTKHFLIDVGARYRATKELLDELGINVDPRRQTSTLSVAMMQLVEIARAVSYDAKLIIMDEPTSALTNEEVELLYRIVRDLTAKGVTIVFISHKIEEIFKICDNVTVLRDGHMIGTKPLSDGMKPDDLITMIVGRDLSDAFQKRPCVIGDVVFEVRDLERRGVFQDVSFQVRRGEIVGFSGLMGAGRSEIARAIFGIDRVTEDRLRMGAIYTMSVKQNMTLANLFRMVRLGIIRTGCERQTFRQTSERLSVKYAKETDSIKSLSGGNQQKVILGRWIMTSPQLLILDEPTRGIDVGAKMEIYKLINDLAEQGVAIMFISSEMPEILSLCDRTFVVKDGKLVYECARDQMTQELLAEKAFGLKSS